MASLKFGISSICFLGGGLALLLQTGPAFSAPNTPSNASLLERLYQRIVQLEERTATLQRQVDQLQKQVNTMQHKSPSTTTLEASESTDDCSEPFFRDSAGVLRVRRECLTPSAGYQSKNSCNPPFSFDASGEKRDRAGCMQSLDGR